MEKPVVTIVHTLPGRMRVRLSRTPGDAKKMLDTIREHDGMGGLTYTPQTRSVLVLYDPFRVTKEEIVLRIALSLSLDAGAVSVRVLSRPEQHEITDTAVYSAIGLLLAAAMRKIAPGKKGPGRLDWAAGAGTALAVLDHGLKEVRERGYFDPEVLSLGYLVTAFLRGNFLTPSMVTWFLTFGRHLLNIPRAGIEIRPVQVQDPRTSDPHYEVVVGPDANIPDSTRLVSLLSAVLKYAATGGGTRGRGNLLEDLRAVSKVHGEVLEGMGWMPQGIPMRFR